MTILAFGTLNVRMVVIDYASGNDANTGLAKTAPWKRAPGMKSFAGAYSHTPGDRFIFRGGVTWPTACYQWKITWGGTSESVRDCYSADTNWFAGQSFKKPLFDFERRTINGWTVGAGVLIQGVQFITFDNLEFANHAAPLQGVNGVSTWGCMTIVADTCDYVTLAHTIVRDWWQPHNNGVLVSGGSGGGGFQKVNTGVGHRVTDCEFHQQGSGVMSGTALWNIPFVENSHIHHTPQAIMSANVIRNNYIHDLPNPGDPAAHSNAVLSNGSVTATGNLIHDTQDRAQVLFFSAGYYGPDKVLCQSNTVFNVSQPCIAIDTDGKNDSNAGVRILDNTLVGPGGIGNCIRVGNRNNGPLGALEFRGNRLISTRPLSIEVAVTSLAHANNITNSLQQAAAAGLTASNCFGSRPGYAPAPIQPDPQAITNTVTITNYVTRTVTMTNILTVTNVIDVLPSSVVWEGKIIMNGIWTKPQSRQ